MFADCKMLGPCSPSQKQQRTEREFLKHLQVNGPERGKAPGEVPPRVQIVQVTGVSQLGKAGDDPHLLLLLGIRRLHNQGHSGDE